MSEKPFDSCIHWKNSLHSSHWTYWGLMLISDLTLLAWQENVQVLDARLPPPPPRRPRRKPTLEPNQFIAPSNLVASDLDKQSPQFRIVYVRHFHQLRGKFPILDKTMYWTANKELGVGLRRFQQLFWEYAEDKLKVDKEEIEDFSIPRKIPSIQPERKQIDKVPHQGGIKSGRSPRHLHKDLRRDLLQRGSRSNISPLNFLVEDRDTIWALNKRIILFNCIFVTRM